ncbi:MAG: MFS transporter [Acidobacteria bacterium]|nr:MAG: MFS transporter [Acidobacteriota bacterium]
MVPVLIVARGVKRENGTVKSFIESIVPLATGHHMTIPHLRWIIAAMLCGATLINYADRQALAVVSVDVLRDFRLTERDYSHILTLFFLAYAIMYAGSGYVVDRLGTRRGFAVFIVGWSIAQMLHALAVGKWSMATYRFMLGLSEPGAWPAAAKAVGEWFAPSQRALGMGIFNAGSSLGSLIAPPLVAFLTLRYGWRAAFVFTGALGVVWVVLWLILYQPPHKNRFLRQSEFVKIREQIAPAAEAVAAEKVNWVHVVRMRGCWTLILTRFFTDPVIYFVIFWLPQYLRTQRGFDLAAVGKYAFVPFVFGGIGYVLGGWWSGRLMRAGWTLPRARKFVMLAGAAVMPVSILAPVVPAAWMAIAATCLVTFGHALWVANLQALPIDLFRGPEIGTATGFSGTGGAIGGMLAQLGTGYLVTHLSYAYTLLFLIAGLVHPLSAGLTYWLLPDREFTRSKARGPARQ